MALEREKEEKEGVNDTNWVTRLIILYLYSFCALYIKSNLQVVLLQA